MFDFLCGNSELKSSLKNQINNDRLPHAIIIEGDLGSGRHTLAKIIASASVCEGEQKPCGKCRHCVLAEKDSNSDIYFYEPIGASLKIQQIREIRTDAFVMPIEAKKKVYILSECETLTPEAQNAFLKVLEEPPSFVVFILICTSANILLPTIRSRCITIRTTLPSTAEATDYLVGKGFDKTASTNALNACYGNLGQAISVLENEKNQVFRETALSLLQAIKSKDRYSFLFQISKLGKDKNLFIKTISELKSLCFEALKADCISSNGDISAKDALSLTTIMEKALESLKKNCNKQLLSSYITAQVFNVILF